MSKRNLKPSGEGWVQLIAGLGFIVLLIVINIIDPTFYPTMWHLATSGAMEEIAEYIQSFGPMAMVVSMVLDIFVNAVGFLPSIFISTANGLVFGMWPGIIIYFLRDTADKLIEKSTVLMKVDDFSGKNGFVVMLFARSLPYFPSGVITALGAISKIKPRDYILANLIGKFPSTALEVAIGTDIVNFQENMGRLGIIVVVAGVVYFVLWKVYKNYMDKKNAEQEHDPNA